ncbi:Zinc/iron permease [Choiromyces venosus 120613-1]|uniref:Zinc/iron permease n=1 Tax=Choiromyces venosus 120613-1 TaxID=1336337 RepID=A0A3N4IVD4_9PEZI|nr:Zinc/iron permease [Choiromyces venosus 120613-1]
MGSFQKRLCIALSLLFLFLALVSAAEKVEEEKSVLELTSREVEGLLQECPLVQKLNHERLANSPETSSVMKRIFAVLFPAGPAVNSLLATAYISGPPNFLLALVPTNIDPSSLSVMVAFAVGGLLGDTLLHLIPQTFMGEPHGDGVHFVMLDPKRNALLGLFIFVGFVTFVAMDKTMRILGGGDGHSHSHSHSHENSEDTSVSSSTDLPKPNNNDVKNRKGKKSSTPEKKKDVESKKPEPNTSIKLSSYLNLIADFSHNITDGLAMSAAFYAGPMVGATTTVAVFFHEIPHEVGDFALLVQSGFTKWQAMGAQFFTAVGAFLGTFIGIAIQTYSASGAGEEGVVGGGDGVDAGIWGTGLSAGDLVLPFTAGTFLYVGFSVIPELLETGKNKGEEVRKSITQAIAMALGFGIMFAISWAEG